MNEIKMIDIGLLEPHPDNPRKNLGDLTELTDSIKKNGIMQNLTVVSKPDGMYRVVIGHRRIAASKAAGLTELPCTIAKMDDRQQLCTMMEENMQRKDLTIPEQAYGFQYMLELDMSVKEIAQTTGFSESLVRNRLEIAKLDPKALEEAVKNEEYQWSVQDFVELNRIKDTKERNRILNQKVYGRGSLVSSINAAVKKEKEKEAEKKLIPVLKEKGFLQSKDSTLTWSSAWEVLQRIDLAKPERVTVEPDPDAQIFYMVSWGTLYIAKKKPEDADEDEAQRIRKAEIEDRSRRRNGIEKLTERILQEEREFLEDIVNGKVRSQITNREALECAWETLMEAADGPGNLLEKHVEEFVLDGTASAEEVEKELKALISGRDILTQMVICAVEQQDFWIMDWNGCYREEDGKNDIKVYKMLNQIYEFEFSDPEFREVLSGQHELYTQPE